MSFDIQERKFPPTLLTNPYTCFFPPQERFSYSWLSFMHTDIRIKSPKNVTVLTELLWINKLFRRTDCLGSLNP